MEILKINRKFGNRKEMENFSEKICEEYIVCLVVHGEEENSIEEIVHFGKR